MDGGGRRVELRFWPLIVAMVVGAGGAVALRGLPGDASGADEPSHLSLDPPPPVFTAPEEEMPPPQPAPEPPPPSPPAPTPAPEPIASAAEPDLPGEKLRFREIWAYLMPGEEALWDARAPLTDVGLFDFSLDVTGRLKGRANARGMEMAKRRRARSHLVVASSGNKSLLHLALSPRHGVRAELLAEIARLPALHPVDGVQIDFEGPRAEERGDLVSFVRDLKAALPPGIALSLALPAKTTDSPGPFVYADLSSTADRLFLMIYDLHWRGGPPGPISDLSWHEAVLACAGARLPRDRVVAGLPFYGRVWQREEVARAVKHAQAGELATRSSAPVRRDPARSHSFTFKKEVTAECWFEDAHSLYAKLASARAKGFTAVGFWRLGQEDPRIWDLLERE